MDCLFQILSCTMYSAFNQLIFFILCSYRFVNERAMCSGEIALKIFHYLYYIALKYHVSYPPSNLSLIPVLKLNYKTYFISSSEKRHCSAQELHTIYKQLSFRLIPKKLMTSYTGIEECEYTNITTKRKM